MCGFAGVVAWDDRYRVSRETLGRMSAAIAHRGPDGEGSYINHEGEVTPERPQVALAFRRLAILDPDPRSNQPFTDGRHWLVFNGEIYNFRELRAELKSLDPYEWRTSGDTEVLLRAYAVWGEKCVERLNGMFAFAVWDESQHTLFLARDRMGQKPLYISANRSGAPTAAIAFASELPALSGISWTDRSLDTSGLEDYLQLGYLPDGQTIYSGLGQVRAASHVRITRDRAARVRYFDAATVNTARPPDASCDETRSLVRQAVTRQLVSDVPIGCFLSGGVDSSVIAACMRYGLGPSAPLMTFSIGFDDPRYDESAYAERVASHVKSTHRTFRVLPDAADDLPRIAEAFGEPFGDSSALPTYYLSRATRAHVKVALSGDGGDELFGGYDRYRAMRLSQRLRRVLPWTMIKELHRLSTGRASIHPKSSGARARRFLASIQLTAPERYRSYVALFDDPLIEALTGRRPGRSDIETIYERTRTNGIDVVQAALATDRLAYLPGDLLTKVDRTSMSHNLEVRSPFMDHELVQFAASLTTDQLLKGGPKRMLRDAFAADLPDFVFKRKKMGFAVPIGEWFRGELRPMLRDHLFASSSFTRQHFNMPVVERLVDEHEQSRVDHSQRLYALLMLELWWRLQTPAAH
jgi:asparagine synthase (glutamine-hydrolysing)